MSGRHRWAWLLLAYIGAAAGELVKVTCEIEDHRTVICEGVEYKSDSHDIPGSSEFYLHLSLCIFMVLFAGLMSGLTLGLLSLDITSLMVLKNSGPPKERMYAARIIPLVKHKHLLLVTLLLCNAAAMETLPLFLDMMVPAYLAILLSVTCVLFFGEIIPQAFCARYGLAVGYYTAWLVKALMAICFVIAWPISKLLDYVLGHEKANLYARGELKELVYLHGQSGRADHAEQLTRDEVTIIKGAMDMAHKKVGDVMTSLDNVYSVDSGAILSRALLEEIIQEGHSRIPIFQESRDNIVGGMLVKQLVLIDPASNTPVRDVMTYPLHVVSRDLPLFEMLNRFQTGKSHLAVVNDPETEKNIGIITLEDVIEELINEEIIDETDIYIDVERRVHVIRPKTDMARHSLLPPSHATVVISAGNHAARASASHNISLADLDEVDLGSKPRSSPV